MRPAQLALAALLFAAVIRPTTAFADDATAQQAKAAYDKGVQASDRKDYAEAGKDFAEADALSPNAVALEAALQVAVLADDPILGDELLERSKRDPAINQDAVLSARQKFTGRAGRVDIDSHCDCSVSIDGQPVIKKSVWLLVGKHLVHLSQGTRQVDKHVDVPADGVATVGMPPPDASPPPLAPKTPETPPAAVDASSRRFISPAWAIGGAVVTAGLAAGMIGSALDTKSKYDAFKKAVEPERKALSEKGKSAELRTNVLVAVTAVAGTATIVLGVLSAPIRSPGKTQGRATLGVGLGGVSLDGTF